MRYVWIVLLALSLSTVVYGQKSAAVRQLEQQRKEALADIEETNKLLQETAQTAKTSLNRLNLLSKQILSRKKVISLLNQELDEIEKDILNIQGQLRTLKRELGDKQTNYGKSMRGLYKRHSSQDKLLFILSAESFSQSMRRCGICGNMRIGRSGKRMTSLKSRPRSAASKLRWRRPVPRSVSF